jgi:hypothetical protein
MEGSSIKSIKGDLEMLIKTLILSVALVFTFSGCGGADGNTNAPADNSGNSSVGESNAGNVNNSAAGNTSANTEVNSFPSGGDPSKPFSKTLELQGITFVVECDNSSSTNKLTITPKGLEGKNEVIEAEADGGVTGAEVADLDANGSPEVYVYVSSAGSGSYGRVIGYAANNKKSLSMINFPEMDPNSKEAKGYMGHDEFAVVENVLVRRFPIYKEGDSNAKPTGGTRQVQYKLKQGEAAWQMAVDKVLEY